MLFYVSCAFTLIPFFISIGLCLYYLEKWRSDQKFWHINKYFETRDSIILCLSVFVGFYASLAMIQSKLFYLNVFHLQMKPSELDHMKTLQFVNIVLIEVIMCVPVLYVYICVCVYSIIVYMQYVCVCVCH